MRQPRVANIHGRFRQHVRAFDGRAQQNLRRARPVYETLPGWRQEISTVRSLEDLPVNARKYLARLGEIIGRPVEIVSVGPDRDQTMFADSLAQVAEVAR